jgi:hypothetical protein
MKIWTMMFVMVLAAGMAHGQEVTDSAPAVRLSPTRSPIVSEILDVPPEVPVSPYDVLQNYESEMNAISGELDTELSVVLQAVENNDIDPADADYISEHRFQLAMMRYELLSVLHADLAKSIANAQQETEEQPPDSDVSPTISVVQLRQKSSQARASR